MNPLVNFLQIGKKFNLGNLTIFVLKKINLQIFSGEFCAIIGPSGSGKSTLMHIMGCLLKPSEGKYFFENKEVSVFNDFQLAEIRNRKIGFVFQAFNLLPKISALANVELPLLYLKNNLKEKKKSKDLAKKKLIELGLENRLEHHPNQLSGGEQQRVAIARALINNPSLILADEPTGNLDSRSGKEIINILKNLNQKGQTIVLVTHDISIAKQAKRIISIKDGRIASDKKQ